MNRASDGRGGTVVIERCPLGAGDVSLTLPLIPGEPLLASPIKRGGAHYRRHRCPTAVSDRAFSAASFEGKRGGGDLGLSNISYRTSGPKGGGRP